MTSSGNTSKHNVKKLLQEIRENQFLQDESTDTSLKPGEQYPVTPHPYMSNAHKQRGSTVNQITELLGIKLTDVPQDDRQEFQTRQQKERTKWAFPYTVDNPVGSQAFQHWMTSFNNAILQTVTLEFQKDRRITKEGRDLLETGTTRFLNDDGNADNTVSAKGLHICQPLLMNHIYYCRNPTILDLKEFCKHNRADLETLIANEDAATKQRAKLASDRYQALVFNQLKVLQGVSSHTAQVFLRELVPSAKTDQSELFVALASDRQQHYAGQLEYPIDQRTQYGMHYVFKYLKEHIVRDDQVTKHVVEHKMLLHTRPPGENIHKWRRFCPLDPFVSRVVLV